MCLELQDEDEPTQPPEPTSGLQQVHDLADFLVQLRSCRTLSRSQEVVVENARVMARTNIQLLAINNATLILW